MDVCLDQRSQRYWVGSKNINITNLQHQQLNQHHQLTSKSYNSINSLHHQQHFTTTSTIYNINNLQHQQLTSSSTLYNINNLYQQLAWNNLHNRLMSFFSIHSTESQTPDVLAISSQGYSRTLTLIFSFQSLSTFFIESGKQDCI